MVFADPPYLLSNGGFTVHAGRRVSVNKGEWDKSNGLKKDFEFTNIEYSQRTFGNLENSVQNYNSILEKLAND